MNGTEFFVLLALYTAGVFTLGRLTARPKQSTKPKFIFSFGPVENKTNKTKGK